jgi:peroxiredoxin
MNKIVILLICIIFNVCNADAQNKKSTIQYPIGLKVPSKAPLFTAKDNYGNDVILQETFDGNPVVLIFYQGYWSRPCYDFLKNVSDSLKFLDQKSAVVIGVSPEQGQYVAVTESNVKAEFALINDTDMKICKAYQVNYALDRSSVDHLKKLDVNLNEINGPTIGNQLPVTAVYIINRDGYIVYKYFDTDVTHRPSVWELAVKLGGM